MIIKQHDFCVWKIAHGQTIESLLRAWVVCDQSGPGLNLFIPLRSETERREKFQKLKETLF